MQVLEMAEAPADVTVLTTAGVTARAAAADARVQAAAADARVQAAVVAEVLMTFSARMTTTTDHRGGTAQLFSLMIQCTANTLTDVTAQIVVIAQIVATAADTSWDMGSTK